jgi:23S rRNA (uracil1939-C5)-methyltransferase
LRFFFFFLSYILFVMKKQTVQVRVEALSAKGNGLGSFQRIDGEFCKAEIPFTMPGDTVKAVVSQGRRGLYSAVLENVENPSPNRIQSKCVHFGSCGGCRWQHIPYEMQLRYKEEYIKKCFSSIISSETVVHPIVPCDPPWNYRNKMEFSFSQNKNGDHFLGLILDSSKGKVFNLTECHLINPWVVETLQAVREWWLNSGLKAYKPNTNQGSLRTLTFREGVRSGDRMAMLTVSGDPEYALKSKDLESFVKVIRSKAELQEAGKKLSIFLRIQQIAKGSPTEFYEMQLYGPDHIREELNVSYAAGIAPEKFNFTISPSAFFQPNTRQAEKLYSQALKLVGIPLDGVVYDLYCGTGTLGLCSAKLARKVIGIELSYESSLDARTNAKENGCSNIEIITGSVPEVLARIRKEQSHPDPDAVIVDPPRAGLDPLAIQQLRELSPSKILYISCNPATQAVNIAELLTEYRLTIISPVDQFPQTAHIENIAVLEKK